MSSRDTKTDPDGNRQVVGKLLHMVIFVNGSCTEHVEMISDSYSGK